MLFACATTPPHSHIIQYEMDTTTMTRSKRDSRSMRTRMATHAITCLAVYIFGKQVQIQPYWEMLRSRLTVLHEQYQHPVTTTTTPRHERPSSPKYTALSIQILFYLFFLFFVFFIKWSAHGMNGVFVVVALYLIWNSWKVAGRQVNTTWSSVLQWGTIKRNSGILFIVIAITWYGRAWQNWA